MKQSSIFEGVVRSEDSYTNLLRNLMLTDEAYGSAICGLLRPKRLNLQLTSHAGVRTQVPLKTFNSKHGRADMLIETKSSVLLIEVKTALDCGLTGNQDFGLDENDLALR